MRDECECVLLQVGTREQRHLCGCGHRGLLWQLPGVPPVCKEWVWGGVKCPVEHLLSFLCWTCLTHHYGHCTAFLQAHLAVPQLCVHPQRSRSQGAVGTPFLSSLFPTTSARGSLKPNHDRCILAWSPCLWKLSGQMPWALQSLTDSTWSHFPSNPWTKADGSAHNVYLSGFSFF